MAEFEPGVYERLMTTGLDAQLQSIEPDLVDRGDLDPDEADEVLARHLAGLARRALRSMQQHAQNNDRRLVVRQVEMANEIVGALLRAAPGAAYDDDLVAAGEELREILERTGAPCPRPRPNRPEVPRSKSALLVNGRD